MNPFLNELPYYSVGAVVLVVSLNNYTKRALLVPAQTKS